MATFISGLCGWLLFASLLVSLLHGFNPNIPLLIAGGLTLLAAVLLFSRLIPAQKLQMAFFSIAGLALMLLSDVDEVQTFERALTVNYSVIALLLSVRFLRLITQTRITEADSPQADKTLWKTLLGVFAFTAVINFSAVVIFGDRLAKNHKLDKTQFMILSRMLGANALYSPFFVGLGVAMIHSGGAQFYLLLTIGFLMALCGVIATGINCSYVLKKDAMDFNGYPMHFETLSIPILLTLLVLVAYFVFENVSHLTLVSAVIVLTVMAILFLRQPGQLVPEMKKHIETNLSNAATEVILFLSAGILAVGISEFSHTIHFLIPFAVFDGYHAAIILLTTILASLVGVHPIVSISVFGGLLTPLAPN
ncbi:MAG: hypothetical protein ACR2P9_06010, partial [Gammaproteobacteria bacterium]